MARANRELSGIPFASPIVRICGPYGSFQSWYVSPYVTAYAPPAYKLSAADALALEEPFELDAEANKEAGLQHTGPQGIQETLYSL